MREIDDRLMDSAIIRAGILPGTPDWEDMLQEARLRRWQMHDQSKSAQFLAIRNRVVDLIRMKLGRKNQKHHVAQPHPYTDVDRNYPASGEIDRILDALMIETAMAVLSHREAYIMRQWSIGYRRPEIAEMVGLSTSMVSVLIQQSLGHMRKAVA